ncbi:hypothetical protein KKB71_00405 [Patescibacteria group bacterium]|nr:hypothetical protein [Patescibacteria group bacterium]MBU2218941.1 hypothetical protein [Patescibacteria group bacterium]MBU2263659.1 hypothetical protein [Patescibacteria group bacterium]
METITIPKNLIKNDDLVILTRKTYENLLKTKKIIPLVNLTSSEKESVKRARKEISKGEYITLRELEYEMGIARSKKC